MERLVQALQTLPSVGPKTATRLALHLVHRSPDGGQRVVVALTEALDKVKLCEQCRNLSDDDICALCTNTKRDNELLCVVESPSDVIAIEQTAWLRRPLLCAAWALVADRRYRTSRIGIADVASTHRRTLDS